MSRYNLFVLGQSRTNIDTTSKFNITAFPSLMCTLPDKARFFIYATINFLAIDWDALNWVKTFFSSRHLLPQIVKHFLALKVWKTAFDSEWEIYQKIKLRMTVLLAHVIWNANPEELKYNIEKKIKWAFLRLKRDRLITLDVFAISLSSCIFHLNSFNSFQLN